MTPLALAAGIGNAAVIQALIGAGADAGVTGPEGESVLMIAARTGRVDAVRLLVARGANVNATERWYGQTAIMWAAAENLRRRQGARRRRRRRQRAVECPRTAEARDCRLPDDKKAPPCRRC